MADYVPLPWAEELAQAVGFLPQAPLPSTHRGVFILFEGADKTGKTTQCRLLVAALQEKGFRAEFMSFPDRTTHTGKLIDAYLRDASIQMDPKAAHLLFAANRRELEQQMRQKMMEGITLVVDRYAYSGVAYSIANGLDPEWCLLADRGLPAPDFIFMMGRSFEYERSIASSSNETIGDERYETRRFQERVVQEFSNLFAGLGRHEFAGPFLKHRSSDTVHEHVIRASIRAIRIKGVLPIGALWT